MKSFIRVVIFSFFTLGFAQTESLEEDKSLYILPEISIGKTLEANRMFPETNLQTSFLISLGWHNQKDVEWAKRLRFPKTGVTLGYIDFGNSENVGQAFYPVKLVYLYAVAPAYGKFHPGNGYAFDPCSPDNGPRQ